MLLYEHENTNITVKILVYIHNSNSLFPLFTVNQWNYKICFKFIKTPASKLGLYTHWLPFGNRGLQPPLSKLDKEQTSYSVCVMS